MITPTLILPHQEGGKFFRELDAPQLCCGVLHYRLSKREERDMVNMYGEEYRHYVEKTRMFISGLKGQVE